MNPSLFTILGSAEIIFLAWMIAVIAAIFLLLGYAMSRSEHELKQNKLSNHINFANKKIAERSEQHNERLVTVSHQLKTPLAAVTGYASMLLEEDYGRLNAAQIEAITAIAESGKRANHLVTGLLDSGFAEEQSSENKLQKELVQVRLVVSSILQELKNSAEQKKLYLYFDQAHQTAPIVRADETKLRQAILNVIDNAITYTAKGGVTVRMVSDSKGVRLSVHDTGAGIHPNDQPHVFDKFFRAAGAKDQNTLGNGLGMYISRKIIEQHGGSIWIESEGLDKGTTFHIWLPLEKAYA